MEALEALSEAVSGPGGLPAVVATVNASVNASANDTLEEFAHGELRYGVFLTIVICIAYLVVFVVGVLGNVCVVLVVVSFPRMRSPTNLFIANLAIADLLVNVVCLPFTLVGNVLEAWVLGAAICKTVPFLQGVSVSASINTLVCISVERCLAICYPLRCQLGLRTCRLLIASVWAASLTLTLPWAVVFHLEPVQGAAGLMMCTEVWPSPLSQTLYFALAHLSMCYLLPLACISVCYALIWRRVCMRTLPGEPQLVGQMMLHRSKMKAVKMLLVVVVSFALSWMPLYAMVSRLRFGPPTSDLENDALAVLLPFAQWLGVSNSCVNPIFYAYFNRKFRAGFTAILSNHCCLSSRYEYDQCSVEFRWQQRGLASGPLGALAGAGTLVGVGAGAAAAGQAARAARAARRGSTSLRDHRREPAAKAAKAGKVGKAGKAGKHLIARANTVCEVAGAIPRCRVQARRAGAGAAPSSGATLV